MSSSQSSDDSVGARGSEELLPDGWVECPDCSRRYPGPETPHPCMGCRKGDCACCQRYDRWCDRVGAERKRAEVAARDARRRHSRELAEDFYNRTGHHPLVVTATGSKLHTPTCGAVSTTVKTYRLTPAEARKWLARDMEYDQPRSLCDSCKPVAFNSP